MELYVLDSLLRRNAVIDRFESLIWTERFSAWGDFELVIFSTVDTRKIFIPGTRLALSESYRVMVIEETENTRDSEGRLMLTVKGRSLEAILEDRTARNTFADLDTTPKWVITDKPADIMRTIFDTICRTNVMFANDEIPFLQPGNLFPPSTTPEPEDEITVELDLQTVYEALTSIADAYDLGFRLVRNFDESELYFDIYTGSNRTTSQNVLAPVVFSPSLDNLTNTSELVSVSKYKNVAYVFHPIAVQVVTADNVSVDIEGFERRVMHVDASDIEIPERPYTVITVHTEAINKYLGIDSIPEELKDSMRKLLDKKRMNSTDYANVTTASTNTGLTVGERAYVVAARDQSWTYNTTENTYMNGQLQQRGREELAKNRSLNAFDGEIPSTSPYKYNVMYNLGDLVEMRNDDGVTNQMRVTEQIFVSDGEGDRAYPTLTVDLLITPGSWLAWDFNQVWEDADGTWSEA